MFYRYSDRVIVRNVDLNKISLELEIETNGLSLSLFMSRSKFKFMNVWRP